MNRTVAYQSIRNGLRVDFPRDNRPPASCGSILCADYSVNTNPAPGFASITTLEPEVWIGETRTFVFTLAQPANGDTTLQFHMPDGEGLAAGSVTIPDGETVGQWTSDPLANSGAGSGIVFTADDMAANAPIVSESFYPFEGAQQYMLASATAEPNEIASGDTVTYTLTLDHPMALADSGDLVFSVFPPGQPPIEHPVSWVQGEASAQFDLVVSGSAGEASTLLDNSQSWYGGGSTMPGSSVVIS